MSDVAVKFRRELSILFGNIMRKSFNMPILYIKLKFTEVTCFDEDHTSNIQPTQKF